jgi:hypothetical protein
MKPLYIGKKGPLLDTYERFHIYEITKEKIQLNDNFTDIHNPIYNDIIKTCNNTHPFIITTPPSPSLPFNPPPS